jgi:hypothetical protein
LKHKVAKDIVLKAKAKRSRLEKKPNKKTKARRLQREKTLAHRRESIDRGRRRKIAKRLERRKRFGTDARVAAKCRTNSC